MKKKLTSIILAAGQGSRMNSKTPKQYLLLDHKPVLFYSLDAFQCSEVDNIILVAGKGEVEYCEKEIVDKYKFSKVTNIIEGGDERYQSVYKGLKETVYSDYVLIHDGARPLISQELIQRIIKSTIEYEAAIVCVPTKDTIRIIDEAKGIYITPERKSVWNIQTPQGFKRDLITTAYDKLITQNQIAVTDDAMVLDQIMNRTSKIVMGSYENIKITTPEDLQLAELLLSKVK